MVLLRSWQRAIIWTAIGKVVSAIALYGVTVIVAPDQVGPRHLLMAAHVMAFGGAAALLLISGRQDLRAVLLGATLLLTASVFGDSAPLPVLDLSPAVRLAIDLSRSIQVDAFTPWFLWLFVQAFPRPGEAGPSRSLPMRCGQVALGLAIILFAVNLLHPVLQSLGAAGALTDWVLPMVRREQRGAWLYWLPQYVLTLAAFPMLVWKARTLSRADQRRISLLLAGIIVGTAPTVLWVLSSSIWTGFRELVPLRLAGWLIYPSLLATPFIIAYAVLVRQALDARLIIRRAIQYGLARYTVVLLALLPLVILGTALYRNRNLSVLEVATGPDAALILSLTLAALLAWRGRRRAIEFLDRRFFREQYDSRAILRKLVEHCGRARNRPELAESLRAEIDRALHLESLHVLYLDLNGLAFSSPLGEARPLRPSPALVATMAAADGGIEVDLEHPSRSLASLPDDDRHWLADAGTRLILPLKDADRRVIGVVSLGEKRSELPFSEEDRQLLATVAAAAAIALAYLSVHPRREELAESAEHAIITNERAMECGQCHLVHHPQATHCSRCASTVSPAPVPWMLRGKFRVVERIGEGGMGIVYRGLDLSLNRAVAIKTLPLLSPDQSTRLRREARAMAAVTHPNLALIFGSESWNGLPVLVVEYLAGGTLGQRLANGPLSLREVIALGLTLADVTHSLHRAGILHRDIKPSNIGYTGDGVLKLLDFGMARLIARSESADPVTIHTASGHRDADSSNEGQIAGTLPYLSPEAVAGLPPDQTFDVWSTCVVMYEALSGHNPAQGATPLATMHRIATCDFPDVRSFLPDADARVPAFFAGAFSADPAARPRTAEALRERLQDLRDGVSRDLTTFAW